jgi:ketosteroid isomerase-like protein
MDAQEYSDCFNRNDFDGFGNRYADDVVFELGDKKRIVGRAAIVDFYRDVKSKVRETIEILSITTQGDTVAAHVRTEFYGLEDWPDFIAGRLMKGERIVTESLAYYYLKNGKFARILGARFRTL